MFQTLWHAGQSTCDFARRYKKVVMVGGILLTGAGVFYSMRKILAEAEKMAQELEAQMHSSPLSDEDRQKIHIERTRQECQHAVYRFLASFRAKLYEELDVETLVSQVRALNESNLKLSHKNRQAQRYALWEEIKIVGLARFLTAVYAFCLLHTLVHFQLHMIGGKAYGLSRERIASMYEHDRTNQKHEGGKVPKGDDDDHHDDPDPDPEDRTFESERNVLASTIDYLLKEGLPMLARYTKEGIERDEELKQWLVHEKIQVKAEDFFQLLKRIHQRIIPNENDDHASMLHWRSFIIDAKATENDAKPKMLEILNEISCVIDSDQYPSILQETLDCCFDLICTDLSKRVFRSGEATPALAKIIPRAKFEVHELYSAKAPNVRERYEQTLTELPRLQELCRSIFLKSLK